MNHIPNVRKKIGDSTMECEKCGVIDCDSCGMIAASRSRMKSGHYWMYTLDSEGNRIERQGYPNVCYYSSEREDISLVGYDVPLSYDHDKHELLEMVVYDEVCPSCQDHGTPTGCGECGA